MDITDLSPSFSVGAQIGPEDVAALARRGFTDIVCNRPDAEHPDGPGSATIADAASRHGLTFHYLPITPGQPFDAEAQRLATVASRSGAKVFAYCRSGARASNAWALTRPVEADQLT